MGTQVNSATLLSAYTVVNQTPSSIRDAGCGSAADHWYTAFCWQLLLNRLAVPHLRQATLGVGFTEVNETSEPDSKPYV